MSGVEFSCVAPTGTEVARQSPPFSGPHVAGNCSGPFYGVYCYSLSGTSRVSVRPCLVLSGGPFLGDVRRLPSGHVYYQVLQDNCRDAVARGVRNWAYGFLTGLRRIGYPLTIRCDTLTSVDPSTVHCLSQGVAYFVWLDGGVGPRTGGGCPGGGGGQYGREVIGIPKSRSRSSGTFRND